MKIIARFLRVRWPWLLLLFVFFADVSVAKPGDPATRFKAALKQAVRAETPLLGYSVGAASKVGTPRGDEYMRLAGDYGFDFVFVGLSCCERGVPSPLDVWKSALEKLRIAHSARPFGVEVYFPVALPGFYPVQEPRCPVKQVSKRVFDADGKLTPLAQAMIQSMALRIDLATRYADVVLVRPFHEANAPWFWWGMKYLSTPEYLALWRALQDAIPAAARSSVVWIYSVDAGGAVDWAVQSMPGKIDVIGVDYYGGLGRKDALHLKNLQQLYSWASATKHFVALSELGGWASPQKRQCIDWVQAFTYQREFMPKLSYVQFWGGPFGMTFNSDPARLAQWLKHDTAGISAQNWVDQCLAEVPLPPIAPSGCVEDALSP